MDLSVLRHSCSHVMAQAVKALWPDVKLAIGPSIEDGFYYDFDLETPIAPEDLKAIEKEMDRIVRQNLKFEKSELSKVAAVILFKDAPYKLELISDIPDEKVTIYTTGDFVDLCAGPHIDSTAKVGAFKLLSIAGAYWRGSEKNKMLTRVYGTAFRSKEELRNYLDAIEKAKFEEILIMEHDCLSPDNYVQVMSDCLKTKDFAYISTQSDVSKFNVKYGVNLVLPPVG
jgi:threonyl-tRNA synthetase